MQDGAEMSTFGSSSSLASSFSSSLLQSRARDHRRDSFYLNEVLQEGESAETLVKYLEYSRKVN